MAIKSGVCPYCEGRYDMYNGCVNKCSDSQRVERMCNDALDDEELIGIQELDG